MLTDKSVVFEKDIVQNIRISSSQHLPRDSVFQVVINMFNSNNNDDVVGYPPLSMLFNGSEFNESLADNFSAYADYGSDSFFDPNTFRLVSILIITVTVLFGLTGNGLVMYVIGRHAKVRQKSVANYYIWNLALADFFYVLALPLVGYATYVNRSDSVV